MKNDTASGELADENWDGIDIIDSDGNRTRRQRQPHRSGNIEERYNRAREEARIREQKKNCIR
jgi:hypothetical protein